MSGRTSLLKATAIALPFSLAAAAAQAASIAETVQKNPELTAFANAIEQADVADQLSGDGPYTVFAPSNQAFEQLPQSALDELMKQENREQLMRLLQHHVVEGEAIASSDLLGQQRQIDTMSGDTLTVDGTSRVVLLVPTGLTIARVGDQMVIQREGVAVSAHAIEVQDPVAREAGAGQSQTSDAQPSQERQAASTPTEEQSDMPMTEHQQQVLESQPEQEQQQTAPAGSSDMPASPHQQQAITDQSGQEQQQAQRQQDIQGQQQTGAQQEPPTTARTPTAEQSGMPITEHQREVIEDEPGQEQRQTASEDPTGMPATEHQREALAEGELPDEQQQSYDEAAVRGEPDLLREASVVSADIQADNGVIHVIDAVLLPENVLHMLEQGGN